MPLRSRHADRLLAAAARHGPSQLRGESKRKSRRVLAIAARAERFGEKLAKRLLQLGQADAILGTLRTGDARLDRREVKLDDFAVVALSCARNSEEALRLVVASQGVDVLGCASGLKQVLARLF